ncbi:MAG TPA: hypothetical protein VEF07_12295 [Candidatus Binataceae bacterium]|nr:hypothetical protein [Candidatus Binataceae bacterium]
MKIRVAAIAAMLTFSGATSLYAGVVVDEQQVIDSGNGQPTSQNVTLMIEGNKQKTQVGENTMVVDLDKGTRTVMNSGQRTFIELPFPPNRPMAANMSPMTFKKTGGHATVAGYSCDEYTGSASMGGNQSSLKACFSTGAPGASDFTAFNKRMAEKVKGTALEMMGRLPDGAPLQLETTTKITHVSMPGMSPDQTAKINDMLAKRPPTVTHMTVTKISTRKLSADTFSVPAGYTKQQMGQGPAPAMMGKPAGPPAAGGSNPPIKVPE